MEIKVSIIVPVYNSENYLKRCLESLVNQSLQEIEIILINDCSTDKSLEVMEKYKQKYPVKIVIINLGENKGPGGARNEGINAAKGEYLGFVDSDDDVSLEMFEELYKIAHETSSDMVDCQFYHEAFNRNMKTTDISALGILDLDKKKELFMHSGFIWSKIIKAKIITYNNIKFRENVAFEDIDFIRIVIFYCKKVSASDMILYNYRNNSTSITNYNTLDVQVYHKMDAIRTLVKEYKVLGAYNDYFDEITYYIYKTYVIMVNYVLTLERKDVSLSLFKDLHDFFFELIDYDYKENKYIQLIHEDDRLAADVNNMDYTELISLYSD